jgi:hypothetical protein
VRLRASPATAEEHVRRLDLAEGREVWCRSGVLERCSGGRVAEPVLTTFSLPVTGETEVEISIALRI